LRIRPRPLALLLLALLPFTSPPAHAQWSQTRGPAGGQVTGFAIHPSNGHVFALANKSLFRSTDGGASWQPIFNGLPGDLTVSAIGANGTTVFVAGNTTTVLTAIYRSSDDGATWTAAAAAGLPFNVVIHAFHFSGAKVLAGLSSGGVYASNDAGDSWATSNTGIAANVAVGFFAALGADLYAGSQLTSIVKGIYRSSDGGATWVATAATPFAGGGSLVGLTANASGVFAATNLSGVYRTTDQGATWPRVDPGGLTAFASSIVATASNLFIGVGASIYKADAAGAGWVAINTGLPPSNAGNPVNALAAPAGALLAGPASWGVYRSSDLATWAPANAGMLALKINGLLASNGRLYAAADQRGFFRSDDHGGTWVELDDGIAPNVSAFGLARTGAGTLLAGAGSGTLWRSADDGDAWTASNSGLGLTGTYVIRADGAVTYAGGYYGVNASTDDGLNWTPLATGFTFTQTVLDLWKKGAVMLAGANAGIKRSIDSGASWTAPLSGLPLATTSYYAFAQVGEDLFFGSPFGVHRSTDDGATWSPRNGGLTGTVYALYADGGDLYAGTGGGVYHSADRGANWTAINDGFPVPFPVFELTGDGSHLIAGGLRHSVWRRPLGNVAVPGGAPRARVELAPSAPNPLRTSARIAFALPAAGPVRLDVFDVTGQRVATLVDAALGAGPHSVSWDGVGPGGARVRPGVYLYRLASPAGSLARKLIVME
jgi:photosystem II stability/assembly factor-like uncharacterized protein